MPMRLLAQGAAVPVDDDDLTARAAWLHYAGGMTQSAVAKRLGLAPSRAHRLVARAARDGLIRVFVDCEVAECLVLEDRLRERFALTHCTVVPDLGEDENLPLKALAQGGSQFLMRVLESGEHPLIGVGHGRTLSAVVHALPRCTTSGQAWVSLLGGLTRTFAANPYNVVFRLAEKSGADAYFLPAPMVTDSVQDRALMLGQTALREVMRRIDAATLCVLGIGTGAIEPDDERGFGERGEHADRDDRDALSSRLRKLGVAAELLGQFLDAQGRLVSTPWDDRIMAPSLATLAGRDVVAIAGGRPKRAAMAAALRSGCLTGLITDEPSARSLVEAGP